MTKIIHNLTEEQISNQCVFSGDLLQVHVDNVVMPDGKLSVREYVTHPGAVVIIPLLDNGNLVFERQHRYPLHQDFYELPAGKIDLNEEPLLCAQRELFEETGYVASNWRYLATLHPCIGYSNEALVYYLATELNLQDACPDEGEHLEVFTLAVTEALEWIRVGKITDNKTISAVFWAEKLMRGEW